MKRVIKPILMALIPVAVAAIVMILLQCQSNKKDREIDELKEQLAKANVYVPLQRDTIRDTVTVATSPIITAELKALRRQLLIDEQLIKDLGLQMKQLDAVQMTSKETKDSIKAEYIKPLKVFKHKDNWSNLQFRLQDTTFYYNIRDSLATIIYHEYKHRFLWWKWGIKGYKVKVVNFNPHSTIRYNSYVKPEK